MQAQPDSPARAQVGTRRSVLWRNIQAGTTTAIIIIPQGMAYALVAGLPAIHGLYASLLPLLAYALLGRSRELAVGPGSIDTLLIGTSLAAMAAVDTSQYAAYAAVLALEVAAIQIALGVLRGGFLVNFLSQPVLSGFTSAAAVIIAVSQLQNLLGYETERSAEFLAMISQAVLHVVVESDFNRSTALVGLVSVAVLLVLARIRKGFPRALFVVLLAIAAVELLGLEAHGVALVGSVPRGLPALRIPSLGLEAMLALLPTAIAIAFVGYLTMISIAKTFADRNRYRINANRELLAAGASNLLGGLSQGFPVSASFSRSAVHASAGSTSPYALLVTVAWVGLTLLFLTDYFYSLPNAALAAIVITAVWGLIDVKTVRRLWTVKRADMWLLITTFVATLVIGIEAGILIGVACSLGLFVYRSTRPYTAVLGRLGDSPDFRNVKHFPDAVTYPGVVIVRFDAQFYFGNVNFLRDFLQQLEADCVVPLRTVIIDACSLNQLDSSADSALHTIADDYAARGIELCFATVKLPVMTVMRASGLHDKLGAEHVYMNVDEAVRARTNDSVSAARL